MNMPFVWQGAIGTTLNFAGMVGGVCFALYVLLHSGVSVSLAWDKLHAHLVNECVCFCSALWRCRFVDKLNMSIKLLIIALYILQGVAVLFFLVAVYLPDVLGSTHVQYWPVFGACIAQGVFAAGIGAPYTHCLPRFNQFLMQIR